MKELDEVITWIERRKHRMQPDNDITIEFVIDMLKKVSVKLDNAEYAAYEKGIMDGTRTNKDSPLSNLYYKYINI